MIVLDFVMVVLAIVLLIPVLVLCTQVLLAAWSLRRPPLLVPISAIRRPSVAVIVPAHNEEQGLANTLAHIMPQLTADDQLVVVADNCSDHTAAVARAAGAITLVRFNQQYRGKGYALDHGMKYLHKRPPEVVMIVDADCEISANLIDTLAKQCVALQRPIQANYVMQFPSTKSTKQQVIEFAWLVKNTIRPLGYQQLGLPCQLMGTGMAFSWHDLAQSNLASGHLVEDMKLGLDLAQAGRYPYYTQEAEVKSYFPTSVEGLATQRARWEHGHLGVIATELPKYLWAAIRQKRWSMLAQVLDLMVPPLALLFVSTVVLCMVAVGHAWLSHTVLPLAVSAGVLGLLGSGILLAWLFFGRKIIGLKSLLFAPIILLMKIPLYIKFVVNRQVDWVRSKRDQH